MNRLERNGCFHSVPDEELDRFLKAGWKIVPPEPEKKPAKRTKAKE